MLIARPKSPMRTSVGSVAYRMFPGLMSRCVTPRAWREGQGARALEGDLEHLLHRQQGVRGAEALHRAARDIFHHDVARILADARVEDLGDVGVLELARERRLGEEELAEHAAAHGVAQRLRENALDRDLAPRGTGPGTGTLPRWRPSPSLRMTG
jgi:hypothetical protein